MSRFILILFVLTCPRALALDIEVRALFDGAALLIIDGDRLMLKAGETSPQGVELIEANSREAVVRVSDKTMTLLLSERISSRFETAEHATVQIPMRENRQYITPGTINGRSVNFLVDTGANVVAVSEATARALGISLEDAVQVSASTASSDLPVLLVMLREITVGPISRNNVQAVVVRGNNPRDPLLGMSFLQHVEISESSGLMTLKSKY